jgi:hypothetical protein
VHLVGPSIEHIHYQDLRNYEHQKHKKFWYLGSEDGSGDAVLPYGRYRHGHNSGTLSWNYTLRTSACVRRQEDTGMHCTGKVSSSGCLLASDL